MLNVICLLIYCLSCGAFASSIAALSVHVPLPSVLHELSPGLWSCASPVLLTDIRRVQEEVDSIMDTAQANRSAALLRPTKRPINCFIRLVINFKQTDPCSTTIA